MRKKIKPSPSIGVGSKRKVTKFLLLPLKINNEIRWLERVTWEEHITERSWWVAVGPNRPELVSPRLPPVSPWIKIRWIDD